MLHNIHDRASMYNQCCLRNFFPYACRHRSLKTFQITSRTFVFAFTTRKGQYSIAVYPCLIAWITGKFFIIFIFKFSKITFCKLVNNPDFRITKQNCRRLKTTLKRTDKYRLRLRICKLSEQFSTFLTQWFICHSDITLMSVSLRHSMTDQPDLKHL